MNVDGRESTDHRAWAARRSRAAAIVAMGMVACVVALVLALAASVLNRI